MNTNTAVGRKRHRRPRRAAWHLRVAVCVIALLSGCMSIGGRPAVDRAKPSSVDVDAAVQALQAAEVAFDASRYDAASSAADSLYGSWRGDPSLASLADRALFLSGRANEALGLIGRASDKYGELLTRDPGELIRVDVVLRYAQILARTGRVAAAVDVALENPGVLDGANFDDLRQWAGALSIGELRADHDAHAPSSLEAQIVYVQLAQLLAATGAFAEARDIARQVVDAGAEEPERTTAEFLTSLEDGVSSTTAKIGAILPLTGELAGVGTLLREGIELALEAYARDRPNGFTLELIIRDDRSDPEEAAALVAGLEREGVVAILGPLRSESFVAVARARRNPRLAVISPTATEVFGALPNAYTLYERDQREHDVAADLARWTVEQLGLRRGAVLRSNDEASVRAASFFTRAFEDAGGSIVGTGTYDPADVSTYRAPIEALAATSPDVVFAPIETGTTVLTIAPQLVYYGLDRSIVLGSEVWADPTVLRRLEAFAADYRVVGLSADRASEGTPWQQFVMEYEKKTHKSLRDNIVPGLAHDAALLVISALDAGGLPIPAAVSAQLASGLEVRGVTGLLRLQPDASTVRRRTQVRMLLSGGLRQPDRARLLSWLADARAAPPREREPGAAR